MRAAERVQHEPAERSSSTRRALPCRPASPASSSSSSRRRRARSSRILASGIARRLVIRYSERRTNIGQDGIRGRADVDGGRRRCCALRLAASSLSSTARSTPPPRARCARSGATSSTIICATRRRRAGGAPALHRHPRLYGIPTRGRHGAGTGHVRPALARGEYGVESLLELDGAAAMLASSAADASSAEGGVCAGAAADGRGGARARARVLRPDRLVDGAAVGERPAALPEARPPTKLKPNGLFLGAMLGETLTEMRSAFVLADLERAGGVAQRMSPLASVSTLARCWGRRLRPADGRHRDHHDRAPGCVDALAPPCAPRAFAFDGRGVLVVEPVVLLAAASAYRECYGDADGCIQAELPGDLVIGWSREPAGAAQRGFAIGVAQGPRPRQARQGRRRSNACQAARVALAKARNFL